MGEDYWKEVSWRREPRFAAGFPISIGLCNGVIWRSRVINLSERGLAVTTPDALPIGQIVVLKAAALGRVRAQVRWSWSQRAGLLIVASDGRMTKLLETITADGGDGSLTLPRLAVSGVSP